MTYKSILVNIDIDGPVAPIVKAAIDLAQRHDATLIGFCAADEPLPAAVPESGGIAVTAWTEMRDEIEKRFKEVKAEFEHLTAGSVAAHWRESLASPTASVVNASRRADLVVMSASKGAATGDSYRVADPASVVLRAGRPVLLVSDKVERLRADRIIVAWKDTREARRAIADAVPLLAMAEEVTVVTVAGGADEWIGESLRDAVDFLSAHGVNASPKLIDSKDEYMALFNFIDGSSVDLVVSGAYGHSRLREWVFGGVTRSLLDENRLNRLLSS